MKKLLFILVAFTLAAGCDKDKEERQSDFCANGFLRYAGNPALDGFGWVFKPDADTNQIFVLENLADNLKTDNLPVNACLYKTENRFSCRCAQPVFYHHITDIKKR